MSDAPWKVEVAPPLTREQAAAWKLWLAITEEAECAPDASLEIVWQRLLARSSPRTLAEVTDAQEAL